MIAFDLDDTLVETQIFLKPELKSKLKIKQTDPQTWITVPGMSDEQVNKVLWECIEKVTKYKLLPQPGTKQAVQKILDILNQNMHIVTARNTIVKTNTEKWSKHHFGSKTQTHFVGNKDKKNYLVKLGVKYWVDDRSDVILECCPVMKKVFVVNRPWNEHTELPSNAVRINHIKEIIPLIT